MPRKGSGPAIPVPKRVCRCPGVLSSRKQGFALLGCLPPPEGAHSYLLSPARQLGVHCTVTLKVADHDDTAVVSALHRVCAVTEKVPTLAQRYEAAVAVDQGEV
jgi:hypothetical protein